MTKIALIGMMGSGKTTIGKKLAKLLNTDFFCTDEIIEKKENKSIDSIFEQNGENYFRNLEQEVVKEISEIDQGVISTGGGVVLNKENLDSLKKKGFITVLINRKIEDTLESLSKDEKNKRPLIKEDSENLISIYKERKELYERYSDFSVNNKGTIEEVVEKLKNELEKRFNRNNEYFKVKGKIIGQDNYLICLPITSKDITELEEDLNKLEELNSDVFEWRVDYFEREYLDNNNNLKIVLKIIKRKTKNKPLILTCRDIKEGGVNEFNNSLKTKIIDEAINTNTADIVDIEMDSKSEFKKIIKKIVINNNKYIILSYHNFQNMPENKLLRKKIYQAYEEHADIIKISCKAESYGDVLRLFSIIFEEKKKLKKPMIGLAMGEQGKISRLFGGYFGSNITFAKGVEESAPGQINIEKIRNIWREIEKEE